MSSGDRPHLSGNEKNRKTPVNPGKLVYATGWMTLFWEELWPRSVRLFIVVTAFLCVSWFGLWPLMPLWMKWALQGAFLIAFLVSLIPLFGLRLPKSTDIIRRIERTSGLKHRPISTRNDQLAFGDDPISKALWQEHQSRLKGKLNDLSSGIARPKASRYDRWALRAMLPIMAVAAYAYSYGQYGGTVSQAFRNDTAHANLKSRMDAWVNPPAYTAKPPIYLSNNSRTQPDADKSRVTGTEKEMRVVEVPEGSEFFLRFVGDANVSLSSIEGKGNNTSKRELAPINPKQTKGNEGNSTLSANSVTDSPALQNAQQSEYSLKLTEPVTLEFSSDNTPIASWRFVVQQDTPPVIAFAREPGAALSGSLQLTYNLEDDYGVTAAQGLIKSLEKQKKNARPLVEPPKISLPLPRLRTKKGIGKVNSDLTQHPWAGSKVELTLRAVDDAGQEGLSQPKVIILPSRNFSNPVALALLEQRRILAMDANRADHVTEMLDALNSFPDELGQATTVITIAMAYRQLINARNDDDLRGVVDFLWDIALGIEYGDMGEAERRLRDAQERLSEALENNASDEEINKLMQELREAMNEYMRQLAEQARKNPQMQNQFSQNDNTRYLRQRDIDNMMKRIEELAKSGSKDEARQLLNELQRMMDNLQAGRQQQNRQAQRNPTNQALDKLSELMRRQQELMDETSRLNRELDRQQQQQQGQQQQSQQQKGQKQQGQRQQGQSQKGQRQQGQQGQKQAEQQGSQGQSQQGQNQQGQMSAGELQQKLEELQNQQKQLQQQLSELGEQLKELGLDSSKEFGEAGNEMGQAEQRLGQGETGSAAQNQANALEALRRGAQSLMNQMAEQGQQQGQGSPNQPGGQQPGSDPLGRSAGGNGGNYAEDTQIPGEVDAQRAREIMEAIRKRLSDPLRPLFERDYLERLLRSGP